MAGWRKNLSAANLLQPILEGFSLKAGAIIGNQGLRNSFMAEQFSKCLKSEVSSSFCRKNGFRPLGIGIHHDKSIVFLQEQTTIISWVSDLHCDLHRELPLSAVLAGVGNISVEFRPSDRLWGE